MAAVEAAQSRMERWRHFAVLAVFKALATLRMERQRTYLGFLWWFFEPLLLMAVFYFVFEVLMDRGGPDYMSVLLSGLVLWQWFGSSIMHCSRSVQNGLNILRMNPVPPAMFPMATFLADTAKFGVVLIVLFVVLMMSGHMPTLAWLALPLVLAVLAVLTSGASLIVASLVPIVPDLHFMVQPMLRGMFFLSGVFYSFQALPADKRHLLEWNPMAVLIDCARQILLHGHFPSLMRLGRVCLVAIGLLAVGGLLFHHLGHRYPKLAK